MSHPKPKSHKNRRFILVLLLVALGGLIWVFPYLWMLAGVPDYLTSRLPDEMSELRKLLPKAEDRIARWRRGLAHPQEKGTFSRQIWSGDWSWIEGHPFESREWQPDQEFARVAQLVLTSAQSFVEYGGPKMCGGFHADYMIEFETTQGPVRFLVCLGCGEVIIAGQGKKFIADLELNTHSLLLQSSRGGEIEDQEEKEPGQNFVKKSTFTKWPRIWPRGIPIPLSGTAQPGKDITIEYRDKRWITKADAQGHWAIELPPFQASDSGDLIFKANGRSFSEIRRLQFGDVWLAVGGLPLAELISNTEAIPLKKRWHHHVLYTSQRCRYDLESDQSFSMASLICLQRNKTWSKWSTSTSPKAPDFLSATYGVRLHQGLRSPLGFLVSSAVGSPPESWIDIDSLIANPDFAFLKDGSWLNHRELEANALRQAKSHLANQDYTRLGPEALGGPHHPYKPGFLWQTTLEQWVDYPVAGVYFSDSAPQGLTAERKALHQKALRFLIEDWRKKWKNPKLPFVIQASLAAPEVAEGAVQELPYVFCSYQREAKDDFGRRLADQVLSSIYGIDPKSLDPAPRQRLK